MQFSLSLILLIILGFYDACLQANTSMRIHKNVLFCFLCKFDLGEREGRGKGVYAGLTHSGSNFDRLTDVNLTESD